MEAFFTGVFDFFKTVFSLISDVYNSFIDFFAFIPQVFGFSSTIGMYLPPFLLPFLGLGIAILVVRVIIDLL